MKFKFYIPLILASCFAQAQNFELAREKLKNNYQYISYPKGNTVIFRQHNGKMGVMDSLCHITAPAKFDYINISCNGRIEAGIKDKDKMKRGYINKKGAVTIPLTYDDVYNPCGSELAIVGIGNKKGAVDSLNTIKIPIEYTGITYANEDRYIVEKNKRYAVFSKIGESITDFHFIIVEPFREKVASVMLPDTSVTLIDLNVKTLFTPLKDYNLSSCQNGICKIYNRKSGKYGFIDMSGKFIVPCSYDDADYAGSLLKLQKNKKWGLYSPNHAAITKIKYEHILPAVNNLFVVKENEWGILDASGKEIVPAIYKDIEVHEKQFILAENNLGRYGVFNLEGKNTIPFEYVFSRIWKDKAFATKESKPVIIDLNTGKTTAVDADSFTNSFDALYQKWNKQIFIKNKKYGVMSIDNVVLIPAIYDSLENIYISGKFIAKQKGKLGIIDIKGIIQQPFEYDKIKIVKENAELTKGNRKPIYYNIGYRDYQVAIE